MKVIVCIVSVLLTLMTSPLVYSQQRYGLSLGVPGGINASYRGVLLKTPINLDIGLTGSELGVRIADTDSWLSSVQVVGGVFYFLETSRYYGISLTIEKHGWFVEPGIVKVLDKDVAPLIKFGYLWPI